MINRKVAMKRLADAFGKYWIIACAIFMLGVNWNTMKNSVSSTKSGFDNLQQNNSVAHASITSKLDTITNRMGTFAERVAKLEGSVEGLHAMLYRKVSMFDSTQSSLSQYVLADSGGE